MISLWGQVVPTFIPTDRTDALRGLCQQTSGHSLIVPSGWLHLDQGDVSEWLAWLGLAALILTVFQLVRTASAAKASSLAIQNVVGKIDRLDLSVELSLAIESVRWAMSSLDDENFRAASGHCEIILEKMARVRALAQELPKSDRDVVQDVITQVGSANASMLRWKRGDVVAVDVDNTVASLGHNKNSLVELSTSLKSRNAGAVS